MDKGKTVNQLLEETSANLAGVVSNVQKSASLFKDYLSQLNINNFQTDVFSKVQDLVTTHLNVNNPMVSPNITNYRNNILSDGIPYKFESWDISKRFVSEHLIQGSLGNISSPFLSDDIVNSLNNAASMPDIVNNNLIESLLNNQNTLINKKNNLVNVLASNDTTSKAFDYRYTKNKYDIQNQLSNLNSKLDKLDYDIGDAQRRVSEATKNYNLQKQYTDKIIKNIEEGTVYSNDPAKAEKAKQEALSKLQQYKDKLDIETSIYNNLVKSKDQVIAEKKNIESKYYIEKEEAVLDEAGEPVLDENGNPKVEKHTEINKNEMIKHTRDGIKNEINELETRINSIDENYKTQYAELISNNVNNVWDNSELTFKDLSPAEYTEALKTVKDPMAKEIISSAYSLDKNSGKYKKSEYFIWEDKSTPDLANGNDIVTIKGVTNLTKNDPGKINTYFTMVDAADKKVEDFYKRKYESDKTIAELNKIKKVIEDYKDINKKQTLETQLTTAKHIQQIMSGDVSISEEVANADSESAQIVGQTISEDSKLKGPIVSLEGTLQQYSWLNDSEVSLIGQDALNELKNVQGLDDMVLALVPSESKTSTQVSANDVATEYANKIKSLFTVDNNGNSLADAIGIDLNSFKYKIDTHLASLNMLNDAMNQLGNNEANVKSWLTELSRNNDMPAATKLKSIISKRGYQDIDSIPKFELQDILKESANGVSDSMNNLDWEILNAIKQAKENNESLTPEIKILNDARSERGSDTFIYNDFMDKGTAHKHDDREVLQQEADNAYYEETNRHRKELDINDRVYLMKEKLITDDNDRIISKIQQKELAVLNADVQNTHMAVKVQNLGRSLTEEELKNGFVKEGLPKPIPVEHFSEFYNLMSLNEIRGTKSATPFTADEWSKGTITFGDKTFNASQFYEYYNKDIRIAQNQLADDEVLRFIDKAKDLKSTEITGGRLNNFDEFKNDINNRLREIISNAKQTVEYTSRPRETGIRATKKIQTEIPLFHEPITNTKGNVVPPSKYTKAALDNVKPIDISTFNIDNILDLSEEHNVRLPNEVFNLLQEYDSVIPDEDKNEQIKYIKNILSDELPKSHSNSITPDDAIEFFKYKQNQLYTDRLPNGRTIYIPKPTDPAVKDMLEQIQNNSEYSSLRRKKDALTYDVVSIDGDYVTTRASRWVSPKDLNLKLLTKDSSKLYEDMDYAQKVLDDRSGLSHEIEVNGQKVNISKAISNYNDSMLDLVESDKMRTANILIGKNYFSRKDLYTKFLGNRYETLDGIYRDAKGNVVNESVPIQSIADKTMSQFEWMIKDPSKARELSSIGEQAVIESLSELDPILLNKNMAIKGISNPFENPGLMSEAIEDSISEIMKGKVLKYYMQDQKAANDSGLIRIAKKSLQINNQEETVEGVQSFLRRMVNIVNGDKDLKRFYGDISKYVNDKQFIKAAMNLESAGDVSFEKLFDDIQLKAANGEFNYDDPVDVQTLVEKQLSIVDSPTTPIAYDKKYKHIDKFNDLMDTIKTSNASDVVRDKYSMTATNLRYQLIDGMSYAHAEKQLETMRGDSPVKETKSTVSDETIISKLAKDNRKSYTKRRVPIESFIKSARHDKNVGNLLDSVVEDMKMEYEDKARANPTFAEMYNSIKHLKGADFVEAMKNHFDNAMEEAKETTNVKIESMKGFVDAIEKNREPMEFFNEKTDKYVKVFAKSNTGYDEIKDKNLSGFDALTQWLDGQEDNNGNKGIRAVLKPEELSKLTKTMKAKSTQEFQQLALLAHIVPGFDMEITGKDSTNKMIRFSLKDIKLNHNDEPGLTVKDNMTGDYVQVANSLADVTSVERMSTMSRNNIDVQRKNITANQSDTPIFLKTDPSKISILPDFKGDYDKITSIGGNKFGKYDPIQTLLNTKDLLNDVDDFGVGHAVTLDYETSGLPDKLNRKGADIKDITKSLDNLPNEVKDYIRKNNPRWKDAHKTIGRMYNNGEMDIHTFNKLPQPIKSYIQGDMFRPVQAAIQDVEISKGTNGYEFADNGITNIYMKPTNNIVKHIGLMNGDYIAEDLNGTDSWLARNYAKYDMPEAANNIRAIDDKVFYVNSDNTLEDSKKTVKEFADQIHQSANKVIQHLNGAKDASLESVIPSSNIYDNQADFMRKVVSATTDIEGNALPVIAHNFSSAEMPWTEDFLKQAKTAATKEIDRLKNERFDKAEEIRTPLEEEIAGLKSSHSTVDFRIKDYEQRMGVVQPHHGLSISPTEQESSKRVIWNGEDISSDPVKLNLYNKKLGTAIENEDEYHRLLGRRDELKNAIDTKTNDMNVKLNEATNKITDRITNLQFALDAFETPIVSDGIDTIHIAKMVEPGRNDYRLNTLISDKNIQSTGPAHLAEVDIANTTKLFNDLVNQPQMQHILESADKPLQKNDIIIKHNTDANGIQFNKGLYQLVENPRRTDGGIEFKFKDLESKSGDVISVMSPNIGTMNRDATRNWIRFSPDNIEVAKAINNEMVKVDSLRTLNNAMGDANIWKLYKTRAEEGGNQGIINRLGNLKKEYDKAIVKSINNYEEPIIHGTRSFGEEPFTDMEHFVLNNSGKLDNANFNNEINRLSKPISDRRMKEFNNVGEYMGTHEGKMVERFLNRAQDRLNAKVINKDEYNAFTANMIDTIKNVKADHNTGMVTIKDNITLGDIDGERLIKLGGGADKLKGFGPRRFNLDLTDSSTLRKSIWNFTNQIGVAMKNAGAVASTEEGKMKALNKYVLPLLQESKLLPTGGQWDNIPKIAANMDAKPGGKVDIPKNMENMLQVAVDHIMDNKHTILNNPTTQHLQEVDMFKNVEKGSDAYKQINMALTDSLHELDYNSAMVPTKDGFIHSENVQRVNTHLTDIAKTARMESEKRTGGAVPFLNVMTPSQAVHRKEVQLDPLIEFNNYNPVSTELARKTATQIKQEADALKVDRDIWTPEYYASKLKYNKPGTSGRKQALDTMPEYTNILKDSEGQRSPDYITSLNDNVLSRMQDAEKVMRQDARVNRAERASMYKELANRASAPSRFRMSNYDERIPTIGDIDATKINAMKALGWAQENNGKLVSGAVGLPGRVTGEQLDPSKILLTTRTRLGNRPSGHYTGLALTDVSLNELRALAQDKRTNQMERNIISRYLNNDKAQLESIHTDAFSEANYYRTHQSRRINQYGETGIPVIEHKPQPENSAIKEANEGIIARGRQAESNAIERSPVSEAIEGMRSGIKDVGAEARNVAREVFNSKAAIAAGIGLAFVGALALARKQHSSDGGTPEQKPNGKGAPTVDGNYDNGYNNNDKAKSIATQKTARVEENGKGMTVTVRAKNPGKANDQQVQDAITGAVNSSIDTKITIHNTDDRSTINSNFVSDIFSQALGK